MVPKIDCKIAITNFKTLTKRQDPFVLSWLMSRATGINRLVEACPVSIIYSPVWYYVRLIFSSRIKDGFCVHYHTYNTARLTDSLDSIVLISKLVVVFKKTCHSRGGRERLETIRAWDRKPCVRCTSSTTVGSFQSSLA